MENDIVFNESYRNIYIVDTFDMWADFSSSYNYEDDLVLTYDLALKLHIEQNFGDVFYIDHLVCQKEMHENNFAIYDFFRKWHLDQDGNDMFVFRGVSFGMSFRLEFWADYTAYMRIYLSMSKLKSVKWDCIHVSSFDDNIVAVLKRLGFGFSYCEPKGTGEGYFFPIAKWMDEQIRPNRFRGLLYSVRSIITAAYGYSFEWLDRLFLRRPKYSVFLQEYHPTKEILKVLRADKRIRLVLCNFSRGSSFFNKFKERLVPINTLRSHSKEVEDIFSKYKINRTSRLIFKDGRDLSDVAYEIIDNRITSVLPKSISTLESCIRYLEANKIELSVLIANIGYTATLFDCVCKSKGIPSYLIINGLFGPEFLDESKYATYINSYSESIKENYFSGMNNIYALGDPRMDAYVGRSNKAINRSRPTVVVGASGFNSVDLNSFVSVEFEFMYSVLCALREVKESGQDLDIIVKVRPNGYRHQYKKLLSDYFEGMSAIIIDKEPMTNVLERCDFYISIYSQTLFEASCLGIPSVYYRADNEIMPPPFDMKSELVTVTDQKGLITAFNEFINSDSRYDPFLERATMEKYVGPLDGGNLKRNLTMINDLLEGGSAK